jgi:hypothetical protein
MCDIKEYGILVIIGDLRNSATSPPDAEPILPNEVWVGWVPNLVWPLRTIEEWYHIPSDGFPLP